MTILSNSGSVSSLNFWKVLVSFIKTVHSSSNQCNPNERYICPIFSCYKQSQKTLYNRCFKSILDFPIIPQPPKHDSVGDLMRASPPKAPCLCMCPEQGWLPVRPPVAPTSLTAQHPAPFHPRLWRKLTSHHRDTSTSYQCSVRISSINTCNTGNIRKSINTHNSINTRKQ